MSDYVKFLMRLGSPLNRVGFLRPDHVFLSQAIRHPTTSFLLCNNLQPLTKEPSKLAYISHAEVKPLIGDNPYEKSEDELIEQYNSEKSVPQMIFLGIDERNKNGLVYKENYKGAPFFAVDVTPKGSYADIAKKVISDLESRGYSFAQGRVMDVEASEGIASLTLLLKTSPFTKCSKEITVLYSSIFSCSLRGSTPTPRLECPQPFLRSMRFPNSLRQRRL